MGVRVDVVEEPCVAVVVVGDLFDGSVGVTADVDLDEPSVAVAVGGGVWDGFDGADVVVEPCEPCVALGGALCEGVGVGPAAPFPIFLVPAWSPVCPSGALGESVCLVWLLDFPVGACGECVGVGVGPAWPLGACGEGVDFGIGVAAPFSIAWSAASPSFPASTFLKQHRACFADCNADDKCLNKRITFPSILQKLCAYYCIWHQDDVPD